MIGLALTVYVFATSVSLAQNASNVLRHRISIAGWIYR
jgi:hypothetical protein